MRCFWTMKLGDEIIFFSLPCSIDKTLHWPLEMIVCVGQKEATRYLTYIFIWSFYSFFSSSSSSLLNRPFSSLLSRLTFEYSIANFKLQVKFQVWEILEFILPTGFYDRNSQIYIFFYRDAFSFFSKIVRKKMHAVKKVHNQRLFLLAKIVRVPKTMVHASVKEFVIDGQYFAYFIFVWLEFLKCDQWLSKKNSREEKENVCVSWRQLASHTNGQGTNAVSFLIFHFLDVSVNRRSQIVCGNLWIKSMTTTIAAIGIPLIWFKECSLQNCMNDLCPRNKKSWALFCFFPFRFFLFLYFFSNDLFFFNQNIAHISDAVLTMTFNAGLVVCYCLVGLAHFVRAGPIDAALNWARADKLPIEIDVNLPWLPCKCLDLVFFFRVFRLVHTAKKKNHQFQ